MRHVFEACVVVAIVAGTGCAGADELDVLEPDARRTNAALGERGPYGVAFTTRELKSEQGSVTADVYRPFLEASSSTNELISAAPLFVFVQGGLVSTERYRWIAAHVASRGSVAVVPHHIGDLAFFAQDASTKALAGAHAASADEHDALFGLVARGPGVVAGHSLGGVVAAKAWRSVDDDELRTLLLLASEPDPADTFAGRTGRVLSIVGSRDGKEQPAKAIAGAKKFDDAQVVIVDGMNHYELTDDPTSSELAGDGAPTISIANAHTKVLAFVDAAVDELNGTPYALADASTWPVGTHAP